MFSNNSNYNYQIILFLFQTGEMAAENRNVNFYVNLHSIHNNEKAKNVF